MISSYRYVNSYWDRYGKLRHYFRRPGLPGIALPGEPGSPEFDKAYRAALAVVVRIKRATARRTRR